MKALLLKLTATQFLLNSLFSINGFIKKQISLFFNHQKKENMKKITLNLTKKTDTEKILLAKSVNYSMSRNKHFVAPVTLLKNLEEVTRDLENAINEQELKNAERVPLYLLRNRLRHYLDYAATYVKLKVFENYLHRHLIIENSGFETMEEQTTKLITVKKGKLPNSVMVSRKAKKNCLYVFEISRNGKDWEQQQSVSASYLFKNLEKGNYFFRVVTRTKNKQGAFTEVMMFRVE